MGAKGRSYFEPFKCGRLERFVTISKIIVELSDPEGPTTESERTHSSCSGMPSCGVSLESRGCPYQAKRDNGSWRGLLKSSKK